MDNKTQKVIPIPFGMVNAYLIKGKGNIIVDAGMPSSIGRIGEVLKQNGVELKDVSLIILTHNHTDHTGGLSKLKALTGARVAIHNSEAEALAQGITTEVSPISFVGNLLARLMKNSAVSPVKPDILIEDELDLMEFGIEGKVIHTPGHTPGSVSIVLSGNEAIVGDMFTGKNTKASSPMFAANMEELKESMRRIAGLAPGTIFTSHGSTCTAEAVSKLINKI